MKHKTWFRLVLKAIGILIIAEALPNAFQGVAWIVQVWMQTPRSARGLLASPTWPMFLASPVGAAVQLLLGAYLLLGANWFVNLVIPSNRPYCPECGYDVSFSRRGSCPECGATLPHPASTDTPQPPRTTQ